MMIKTSRTIGSRSRARIRFSRCQASSCCRKCWSAAKDSTSTPPDLFCRFPGPSAPFRGRGYNRLDLSAQATQEQAALAVGVALLARNTGAERLAFESVGGKPGLHVGGRRRFFSRRISVMEKRLVDDCSACYGSHGAPPFIPPGNSLSRAAPIRSDNVVINSRSRQ